MTNGQVRNMLRPGILQWEATHDIEFTEAEIERLIDVFVAAKDGESDIDAVITEKDRILAQPGRRPELPVEVKAGEIIAWRSWRISSTPQDGPRLKSLYRDDIWAPGEPMRAHCSYANQNVESRNSTGVYAFKTREDAERYARYHEDDTVLGEVELWGRVVEHDTGYRASYAMPISLGCYQPGRDSEAPRPELFENKVNRLRETYGLDDLPMAPTRPEIPIDKQPWFILGAVTYFGIITLSFPNNAPRAALFLLSFIIGSWIASGLGPKR